MHREISQPSRAACVSNRHKPKSLVSRLGENTSTGAWSVWRSRKIQAVDGPTRVAVLWLHFSRWREKPNETNQTGIGRRCTTQGGWSHGTRSDPISRVTWEVDGKWTCQLHLWSWRMTTSDGCCRRRILCWWFSHRSKSKWNRRDDGRVRNR